MATFKVENGLCPYYVAGGVKYYIQDRYVGGDKYEYRLEATPLQVDTIKLDNIEAAAKHLGLKPGRWYREYSDIYELHQEGKRFAYNAKTQLLREIPEPEILTGWFDSYLECLRISKEIVEGLD